MSAAISALFGFFAERRIGLRLLPGYRSAFACLKRGPPILIAPSASGSARTKRLLQIKSVTCTRTICEFHAPALEKHGTLSLVCELMG